jgi:cation transport ATPase
VNDDAVLTHVDLSLTIGIGTDTAIEASDLVLVQGRSQETPPV